MWLFKVCKVCGVVQVREERSDAVGPRQDTRLDYQSVRM